MHPQNKGAILLVVAIVCYTLAFVGTALRIYVRQRIVRMMALDDWLIMASLALYTMYIAFVITGIHYGTGRHHVDLTEHDILMAVRYWYFCEWAYVITMTLLKVGIGVFYLRIMIERWQKLVVKAVMLISFLFGISYFACVVAQCVPVPFIWERYATSFSAKGGCLPKGIVLGGTYLHSIISASSDWILGLLPIAMLWKVNMVFGIKAILVFILGLGALASTATLIRIGVIHHIDERVDFLWVTFDIAIWSTVEPGIALFATGLAALRPLLRSLFPSRFQNRNLRSTVTTFAGAPSGARSVNDTVDEGENDPNATAYTQDSNEDANASNLMNKAELERRKSQRRKTGRGKGNHREMEESGLSQGSRDITIAISGLEQSTTTSGMSRSSREVTLMLHDEEIDVPPLPRIPSMAEPGLRGQVLSAPLGLKHREYLTTVIPPRSPLCADALFRESEVGMSSRGSRFLAPSSSLRGEGRNRRSKNRDIEKLSISQGC